MASIGWIDFSPSHRNRIGSVLDLLKAEGMVDELGLGTIRDSLANQLFPGISTIQTRAKYFFIIPYILYDYQALRPSQRNSKSPSKFLEDRENEIMWQLADRYNHKEGTGVIGITKYRPQKIARRASAIYWSGLYRYNFIDTKGLPSESFLKQAINPSIDSLLANEVKGDDAVNDDMDAEFESMFRLKIKPEINWIENLNLDLTKDEAEFFRDRIRSLAKNHLIAELINNDRLWNTFMHASGFRDFARSAKQLNIPDNIRQMLVLSHDFSEVMYGAHLAYNCQLQKKFFNNKSYEAEWKDCLKGIKNSMLDYKNFNPDDLFIHTETRKTRTEAFVRQWWIYLKEELNDLKIRDSLITGQEHNAKGSKARLYWNKNEDVVENKWIGLTHFDYRFTQARNILNDIKMGLKS